MRVRLRLDFLPAVNGWDSSTTAHASLARRVPASSPTAGASPGLTPAPQAFAISASPAAILCPSASTLRAALRSRSCSAPHRGQVHDLTASGLGPSSCPQVEHSRDDGNLRSTFTTVRPYCSAFSATRRTRVDQPASWIDRASFVRARPATDRSSRWTAWFSADQPQGQLVVCVQAGLPNPPVQHGDAVDGLAPVRRSALLARERPLRPAEAPLRLAEVARVGDDIPVRQHGEPVQAEIHPDLPYGGRQRGGVAVDDERHVVPAVGLPDHRARRRDRRQRPRPLHAQVPDLGHIHPPVAAHSEPVASEPHRLPVVALGPEPRVPDPTALPLARQRVEPVAVSAARVLARLHQGHRRDLTQPLALRGLLRQRDDPALHVGVGQLLPGRVGVLPEPQAVVVDHPRAAERPRQRLHLALRGVGAIPVPDDRHPTIVTRGTDNFIARRGRRRRHPARVRGLRDGV